MTTDRPGTGDRPRSTRRFVLGFLVVALLVAGGLSYWASSSPDGLNKVAADTGIGETEKAHGLEESPFAGYGTKGLGEGFASNAVAGIAGVAITLAVAGGLTLLLRRRSAGRADAGHDDAGHDDAGLDDAGHGEARHGQAGPGGPRTQDRAGSER